jgi:hypothetical protein
MYRCIDLLYPGVSIGYLNKNQRYQPRKMVMFAVATRIERGEWDSNPLVSLGGSYIQL